MKYIRTKDGIHRVFRLLKNGYFLIKISKYRYYHAEPDCKQADTIEELCDEFVIIWETIKERKVLHDYKVAKQIKSKITKVYGAIWTDKGLLYVAKMNDKGELELL